jgi:hypothetical protein
MTTSEFGQLERIKHQSGKLYGYLDELKLKTLEKIDIGVVRITLITAYTVYPSSTTPKWKSPTR